MGYLVRLRSRLATMLFIASKGFLGHFVTVPTFVVTRLLGFTAAPNLPEVTRSILLMMSNKDLRKKIILGEKLLVNDLDGILLGKKRKTIQTYSFS